MQKKTLLLTIGFLIILATSLVIFGIYGNAPSDSAVNTETPPSLDLSILLEATQAEQNLLEGSITGSQSTPIRYGVEKTEKVSAEIAKETPIQLNYGANLVHFPSNIKVEDLLSRLEGKPDNKVFIVNYDSTQSAETKLFSIFPYNNTLNGYYTELQEDSILPANTGIFIFTYSKIKAYGIKSETEKASDAPNIEINRVPNGQWMLYPKLTIIPEFLDLTISLWSQNAPVTNQNPNPFISDNNHSLFKQTDHEYAMVWRRIGQPQKSPKEKAIEEIIESKVPDLSNLETIQDAIDEVPGTEIKIPEGVKDLLETVINKEVSVVGKDLITTLPNPINKQINIPNSIKNPIVVTPPSPSTNQEGTDQEQSTEANNDAITEIQLKLTPYNINDDNHYSSLTSNIPDFPIKQDFSFFKLEIDTDSLTERLSPALQTKTITFDVEDITLANAILIFSKNTKKPFSYEKAKKVFYYIDEYNNNFDGTFEAQITDIIAFGNYKSLRSKTTVSDNTEIKDLGSKKFQFKKI